MSVETATHRLRPPPLLAGRYVIVRRLGKGGAANVYLAHDLQLKRWRAMKVMHPAVAQDRDMRTRFFREARLMALIDHPNVVRVTDVGEDAEIPYMVMEYLQGGCVLDWLRVHGQMPPGLAVRVARDVALGLAATHKMDVVHRDVKPHNILVQLDGSCRLTDFGIAKLRTESQVLDDGEELALTRVGASMGTLAFMPPEQQHNAAAVDERADLYSLGATLFTLLQCKAPQDLYVADANDPQFAGIPASVVEVILKACRYQPHDRYRSGAQMAEALAAVLDGLDPLPEGTPKLALPGDALPKEPPATVDREHIHELLELVATGLALAYDPDSYNDSGTLSSEADPEGEGVSSVRLTIDDYTLTPLAAERPLTPAARKEPPPDATPAPAQAAPTAVEPEPEPAVEPAPPMDPVTRQRAIALVVALAVAVTLVSVSGLGLIAALQAGAIRDSAQARDAAAEALIAALDEADPLIDHLSAKGDGPRIHRALDEFEGATSDLEKLAHALATVELLEKQHSAVVTSYGPQPGMDAVLEDLSQQAKALHRAQAEVLRAQASVGGSMALTFGLARRSENYGM